VIFFAIQKQSIHEADLRYLASKRALKARKCGRFTRMKCLQNGHLLKVDSG
jgi:hypothetical protein